MDLTLVKGKYDTATVHADKNYIINNDSSRKVEKLGLNLGKKCDKLNKYGIKNPCLSGLVFTTRVHSPWINQVKKCCTLDICKAHNI